MLEKDNFARSDSYRWQGDLACDLWRLHAEGVLSQDLLLSPTGVRWRWVRGELLQETFRGRRRQVGHRVVQAGGGRRRRQREEGVFRPGGGVRRRGRRDDELALRHDRERFGLLGGRRGCGGVGWGLRALRSLARLGLGCLRAAHGTRNSRPRRPVGCLVGFAGVDRSGRCGHGGLHRRQGGLLVEELLNVGARRAFRFGDGAALLQGPRRVVEFFPQGLQVTVALVPVRVGDEGEELGGAEGPGDALSLGLGTLGVAGPDAVASVAVRFGFRGGRAAVQVGVFWLEGAPAGNHRFAVNYSK